jgi:hypothetical protein
LASSPIAVVTVGVVALVALPLQLLLLLRVVRVHLGWGLRNKRRARKRENEETTRSEKEGEKERVIWGEVKFGNSGTHKEHKNKEIYLPLFNSKDTRSDVILGNSRITPVLASKFLI